VKKVVAEVVEQAVPQQTRAECAVIALDGVTREYAGHGGVVRALDGATFSIVAGEWVAITGPSGSGKSTLVNLLGCLDRPTSGSLKIDGVDTASLAPKELDRFRADKIGFIFQQFHLIPYLSALENVMLAQYFHSMTDEAEARAALEKVGLGKRVSHLPSGKSRCGEPGDRGESAGRSAPQWTYDRDGDARSGDGGAGAAEDCAEPRQGVLPSDRGAGGEAAAVAWILRNGCEGETMSPLLCCLGSAARGRGPIVERMGKAGTKEWSFDSYDRFLRWRAR
jgi:hypothetical protein